MLIKIKPSEIFYTQDSINNKFGTGTHRGELIGETLDKLCNGSLQVDSIPTMNVFKRDGKWFTCDNRRLWIFHHLQGAGKCQELHVEERSCIDSSRKFTAHNGGVSIIVRNGCPGGIWYKRITPVVPKQSLVEETPKSTKENFNSIVAGTSTENTIYTRTNSEASASKTIQNSSTFQSPSEDAIDQDNRPLNPITSLGVTPGSLDTPRTLPASPSTPTHTAGTLFRLLADDTTSSNSGPTRPKRIRRAPDWYGERVQ